MEKESPGMSMIANGLMIYGNITGNGDMRLAGVVDGEVVLKNGKIIVDPQGALEGNIQVKEIAISGEVKGTIEASSKVSISSSGRIVGDVKTARIDIAEGAYLCGNFEVEDKLGSKSP
ncbi:polymer-forming cytoskeletal protein [bacterium]|nr:polymer-forming cytoskeletal protein [candidate division CSSED10-310 bacterium]